MLLALVLQAAAPQTAVDAERAFNAAAQAKGQWTAFREFAAEDATMFVPQPVKAQEWLKDRGDPPQSVVWWPTASYVSCDDKVAVNTGGWKRPDGSVGYFTTVWMRQPDGRFKWVVDGGDALSTPPASPEEPKIVRPDCSTKAPIYLPRWDGPASGVGMSSDYSLDWSWEVMPNGTRYFRVSQWNGKYMRVMLDQRVNPPAQ